MKADMHERKLYQIACPNYAKRGELGPVRNRILEVALHKLPTGIIKRVDVVDDNDKTVLRRPVVRNQEYIKQIIDLSSHSSGAAVDPLRDSFGPDAVEEASVDKLIEVTKLMKRTSLIPRTLKRSRPEEFWTQNKRTRTVRLYSNRKQQQKPQPPPPQQ